MATSAIIEGCKDAGLAPGEGVSAILAGPEQADLLDDDAALVDRQLGRRPVGWKGGRARGSKNRATRDVVEYVRRAGTDPLIWMSKVASMDLAELKAWGAFSKRSEAAEFQRKVVKDYRDTLYPGSTIADMLKAALGEDGVLQVMGFLALGRARPGEDGAAGPDIHGGLESAMRAQRRPVKDEENQDVSEGDHG